MLPHLGEYDVNWLPLIVFLLFSLQRTIEGYSLGNAQVRRWTLPRYPFTLPLAMGGDLRHHSAERSPCGFTGQGAPDLAISQSSEFG